MIGLDFHADEWCWYEDSKQYQRPDHTVAIETEEGSDQMLACIIVEGLLGINNTREKVEADKEVDADDQRLHECFGLVLHEVVGVHGLVRDRLEK